jgi:hypothetical protein
MWQQRSLLERGLLMLPCNNSSNSSRVGNTRQCSALRDGCHVAASVPALSNVFHPWLGSCWSIKRTDEYEANLIVANDLTLLIQQTRLLTLPHYLRSRIVTPKEISYIQPHQSKLNSWLNATSSFLEIPGRSLNDLMTIQPWTSLIYGHRLVSTVLGRGNVNSTSCEHTVVLLKASNGAVEYMRWTRTPGYSSPAQCHVGK